LSPASTADGKQNKTKADSLETPSRLSLQRKRKTNSGLAHLHNNIYSFFQHKSSLIFPLLTDPAFKNTVHHRWHRTTLYSTTHQLKITL